MEKIIRESLSVPVIKGELIGPEGGSLDVMECKAVYPSNAFQEKTPVRHSVRSDYHDDPEGYVVCSPELECSTFGVPFQGSVLITLPLHILPEDGLVEIFKKESQSSPWTQLHYSPTNNHNRSVTFYVTHFCKIKALFRYYVLGLWKTFLCHYLFYKLAKSQLYALTCIDDPTVKMKCVAEYEQKGFLEAQPQPEKVALSNNEEMRFKYECIEPDTSRLDPNNWVVLTRHEVVDYTFKSVKLCPEPQQNIRSVTLRYWMKPPQGAERESVIVLEWNTQAVAGGNVLRDATVPVQEINIDRCTREFYERHQNDDDIYQFDQNRPKGKVLIINNKFEGKQELERTGSEVDVGNLQMLWTNLGFDVVTKQNLSAEEMLTSCEEFARDTGEVSSVFVIIMSHGGMVDRREFISGEDMGEVPTENIISFFTARNCPHLRGIPKVFMFQACRGNQRDRADAGPVGEPNRPRIPDRADMLIAYPCQSGYVSYRNPLTGSWLMNAVTNIFMAHAHDTDLLGMLTKVNNEVARKEGQRGDVQASNQESYLRRQLYLFPGWPN